MRPPSLRSPFYLLTPPFRWGRTDLRVNPLDLRKVLEVRYRRRLFTIRDPEFEWELEVDYLHPRTTYEAIPTYQAWYPNIPLMPGMALVHSHHHTSLLIVRYQSEEDVLREIRRMEFFADPL